MRRRDLGNDRHSAPHRYDGSNQHPEVWDVSDNPVTGVPGGWAGMGLMASGISSWRRHSPGLTIVRPLGRGMRMTWAAVASWVDEMYVIYFPDILDAQGVGSGKGWIPMRCWRTSTPSATCRSKSRL